MSFDNLSRRNFLKKTTVLAVATSSLSLFSGLAHAGTQYLPGSVTCMIAQGFGLSTEEEFRYNDPLPGGGFGPAYCYKESYCGTNQTGTDIITCPVSGSTRTCGGTFLNPCYDLDWKAPGADW